MVYMCIYMHWWALQSRGGALVDQPLQRWLTGRSSTPGGGQLLDTSSLEVYKHIQIYVYVYIYIYTHLQYLHMYTYKGWLSVSGKVRWWVSHSRGGPLVGPPLCVYIYIHTGGLSTS